MLDPCRDPVKTTVAKVAPWIVAALLMVFAAWLFNSHPVELSIQSLANLAFSRNTSFVAALQSYPHVWPPFYPSVLWGLHRLGISARR